VIWASANSRGDSLPGRFDGRVGHDVLARATATPFYDTARALLDQGLAAPDDVLTMRHAGMQHTVLEATVGKAARLAET
jgi:hypothetical protein